MVTIKIEAKELTFEEADNLTESYLQHHGWACFVDAIYISNKKVFDITDKKDQKWLKYLMEMRSNRIKKIKSISTFANGKSDIIADKQNPQNRSKGHHGFRSWT